MYDTSIGLRAPQYELFEASQFTLGLVDTDLEKWLANAGDPLKAH
jgi:hypothetical protein